MLLYSMLHVSALHQLHVFVGINNLILAKADFLEFIECTALAQVNNP